MRPSSHIPSTRLLATGTLAVVFAASALALTLVDGANRTSFTGTDLAPAAAVAPTHLNGIADAVSSVVRTGATAATATVTGGAAATGASAAALPDTTGSGTVLAMAGVLLTLCAAAAVALLRSSRSERHLQ